MLARLSLLEHKRSSIQSLAEYLDAAILQTLNSGDGCSPRRTSFLEQGHTFYDSFPIRFYSCWSYDKERMSDNLENKSGDTIRILRPPPRVFTDSCGHNVWMGGVEPLELALEQRVNTDPYNNAEAALQRDIVT